MDTVKYPKAPGLTLEQAQELSHQIQTQYAEQIAEAKKVNDLMGRLSNNVVRK